jgi:hypothetical protein
LERIVRMALESSTTNAVAIVFPRNRRLSK